VKAPYRRLTPELRAEHVEALAMLGRLVVALPPDRLQWRRFVVVTATEPSSQ
jgi:predicted RNase H-like nuclease